MKTQVLVVSYLKDKPWLVHCLKSIAKFASGFSGTKVLVPMDEAQHFVGILREELDPFFTLATYNRAQNPRLWHLDHQRMKCRADEVCPDADFILHTDSDCIFTEPVTPEDYFVDGKPVMWIQSYDSLPKDFPWKPVVDACMGGDNKFETMRRHGAVHYRALYKDLRDHIEATHHVPFDEFVLSRKPDFPWGWTEFNMLGVMALSPKWRDKYHIVDLKDGVPKNKILQMWSHSPEDKPQSTPFGFNLTPKEIYDKLGV